MILKVEKQFRDKVSGELRKVGDVFEADEKRAGELLEHPMSLVSVVTEEEKKEKPKAKPKTSKPKSKKSE